MKYCTHCGAEINDEAKFCSTCVKPTTAEEFGNVVYHQEEPKKQVSNNAKTLGKVAFAFMIVTIAILGFYAFYVLMFAGQFYALTGMLITWPAIIGMLLPLAWTIPMTVYLKRKLNANEPIGVGFKVCTLLFVNLVFGINNSLSLNQFFIMSFSAKISSNENLNL